MCRGVFWIPALLCTAILRIWHRIQFPEPGYYRVVAMVSDQSGKVTENGQWIDPADGEEVWLWIDEDGGQVTERFDKSLFPDSLRMQPGPFVAKDAAPRWVPVRNGKAVSGPPSKSGGATLVVTYFDPVDGVNKPLKDARVDIDIYDGYEDKVVGGGTLQTDQNGEVLVECEQEDPVYEVQISVLAENGDVVVYDQADSKQVSYLEDPACGATVVTDAYSSTSHVFSRMDVTIERSRNFFQRSRSKIPVKLSYSEGSLYWPDGWFINGHLYGGDYIVINEGDSRFSNSSGNRIIAHEYGHALHEKGLGGNATPPGGGCPDEHYLRGAHNLTCAFSEGFAQYHAGTTIDSENSFITALEDNEYYPALSSISTSGPLEDGSIIEGAVAAFLYDLTDPANESHDGANYPGMYVAEIIETCKVYEAAGWRRADGVDHLIACFQQSLPDYSTYFPNRGTPPFNFQENASEPGGWQAGDITLLWETNLFDAYTAPLSVTASGSSSLDSGEQGSWTASASGGNGSYSYQWFDKYEQDSGFQSISGATTSSYSASYYGNVTLKVEVTSGGSTDSDTHEVSVDCSTGPCVESLDEAQVVNR